MDRESHRAAVEAGYASLAEYIKKWGDNKMELLQRLRDPFKVTPQDAAEAADEIERLREALNQAQCGCELPCLQGEFCSSWICRSALQQKESK